MRRSIRCRSRARPRFGRECGHTLVEVMVSVGLLAAAATLIGSTVSFSLSSQREARTELKCSRTAGQIMEILRATSYDSLPDVEDGTLSMAPLSTFHQAILYDLQDSLRREGMSVFVTIRPFQGRVESKYLALTVVSADLSPHVAPFDVPKGKSLIRYSTIVTRKGLNP